MISSLPMRAGRVVPFNFSPHYRGRERMLVDEVPAAAQSRADRAA